MPYFSGVCIVLIIVSLNGMFVSNRNDYIFLAFILFMHSSNLDFVISNDTDWSELKNKNWFQPDC